MEAQLAMRETHVETVHEAPPLITDNPDSSVINECQELAQAFQEQLRQCQDEQTNLRSKLESIIQENQSLSEKLQSELSSKSTTENYVKSLNSNIRQQLDAAIQERDSAVDMWQTSLQLVTALEKELKDYREDTHLTTAVEKVTEVRAEYSRAINLLEEKLEAATVRIAKDKAAREMADQRLQQIENDYKLLTERYEKRCADLDEALIGKETVSKKVEDLEKMYSEALTDAKEAKLACSELEAALERSLSRLEEVLNRETEAREKVDEALQIVDVALIERDNALKNANEATGDVQQLQATISELISEAGAEVIAEAEQIKEQYNSRIKTILLDMRRLQVENKNKNTQIQKLKSDLSTLESELQRTKRELDVALRDRPSLSALDRKLEGLFRTQELAGGDSIRADLEIEQLRAEIVKLTQSNELEQRQYLLERHVLEDQINHLQIEVENSSKIISEYSIKIDALNAAFLQKEHEMNVLKKTLSSGSLPMQVLRERCLCGANKVSDYFQLRENEQKIYQELQTQLDKQRDLTKKWKTEVNLITSRFQTRLRELHAETSALRKENREIQKKLEVSRLHLGNSHVTSIIQ